MKCFGWSHRQPPIYSQTNYTLYRAYRQQITHSEAPLSNYLTRPTDNLAIVEANSPHQLIYFGIKARKIFARVRCKSRVRERSFKEVFGWCSEIVMFNASLFLINICNVLYVFLCPLLLYNLFIPRFLV